MHERTHKYVNRLSIDERARILAAWCRFRTAFCAT
jgi:hypothetical protein